MSSRTTATTAVPAPAKRGEEGRESALRRLRSEAGFRSAREFARAHGFPIATYARYERASGAPDDGIPLAAAWRIADALGSTIDLVVGREDLDAPDEHPVQSLYDSLTEANRRRADDYLAYLKHIDEIGRRR